MSNILRKQRRKIEIAKYKILNKNFKNAKNQLRKDEELKKKQNEIIKNEFTKSKNINP